MTTLKYMLNHKLYVLGTKLKIFRLDVKMWYYTRVRDPIRLVHHYYKFDLPVRLAEAKRFAEERMQNK